MPRVSLRYGAEAAWQDRLAFVVNMMRESSQATDPNALIKAYSEKIREVSAFEAFIAISRRGLQEPQVMITRNSNTGIDTDPWVNRDSLPLLESGILSELIYAGEARIIDDLCVPESDPAYPYIGQYRSAIVTPVFDGGVALNMNLVLSSQPDGFDPEHFPEQVWTTNLFGRATSTLVLQRQLKAAYEKLDKELQTVARIQRSLLPDKLPGIPSLDLAAYYETSARAGGDYYDVFNLGDGRWGIFMADVCGHGTPAAVLMAITHSLAHAFHFRAGHPDAAAIEHHCPARFMTYLNANLEARYAGPNGTFVTAFFGIFNERTRLLTYANAGHPPPRVKRCSDGTTFVLDNIDESNASPSKPNDLPLGIMAETHYNAATAQLEPGDQVVIYTDGITEARGQGNQLFGTERLDKSIENCGIDAGGLISTIMADVETFTDNEPADDDRTILVGKVR